MEQKSDDVTQSKKAVHAELKSKISCITWIVYEKDGPYGLESFYKEMECIKVKKCKEFEKFYYFNFTYRLKTDDRDETFRCDKLPFTNITGIPDWAIQFLEKNEVRRLPTTDYSA